MEMIMKKALAKKNGKKGFTLVEVIVVLVILAILAAIAIPALTGYIDKANKRAIVSEARSIQIGLQAIASDAYGDGIEFKPAVGIESLPAGYVKASSNTAGTVIGEVNALNGGTVDGTITAIAWSGAKLQGFTFTKSGTGKVVTYSSGKYTVA